jgi:hypothetical protein
VYFLFASSVPLSQYDYLYQIQTAASLRLHASMFAAQMKSWQQNYIFPPELGLPTLQAGGAGDR